VFITRLFEGFDSDGDPDGQLKWTGGWRSWINGWRCELRQ